jgi:hypothetical protein
LIVDQLGTDPSMAGLTAPSTTEHRQIDYWKPNTVGELLFNFWD